MYHRLILEELGITYNLTGQLQKGLQTYKKLLINNPEDKRLIGNINWYENALLKKNIWKIENSFL